MLRDALDAFVDRDAAKAGQIGARDRRVDASYAALLSEVFEQVSTDRDRKVGAARLQALGKYLERIGDHATNVADMVIFMVEGRRDRHR
jgi:phosphate transport system protein